MPNLVPKTIEEWMRRQESQAAEVASRKSNLIARNIADTVDLDDFLWSGRYYREDTAGTTTALGYPRDGVAGTLDVIRNPASIEAQQVFYDRVNGLSWIRWYDGVSWGPWTSGGSESGGLWEDYTPALSNVSVGNGSMSARYVQNGNTVHFWVNINLGSTSSVTGTIGIGVPPVTPINTQGFVYPMGTAIARASGSTGSNVYKGFTTNSGTGTIDFARVVGANGSNGGVWDGSNPFVWSDGAVMSIMAMYEAV